METRWTHPCIRYLLGAGENIVTPYAHSIIKRVAGVHGVDPADITRPNRTQKVFRARVVVAKMLDRRGFSSPQIGAMLNHDHTTILFYLGRSGKRPSRPRPPRPPKPRAKKRWGKPRIAHLKCKGCRLCVTAPVRRGFLIPYAGADMTEYQWKPRAQEIRP